MALHLLSPRINLNSSKYTWKSAEAQITGQKLLETPIGPRLRDTLDDVHSYQDSNKAAINIMKHQPQSDRLNTADQAPLTPLKPLEFPAFKVQLEQLVGNKPSRTPRISIERRKLIPISARKNRSPDQYYTSPASPRPFKYKEAWNHQNNGPSAVTPHFNSDMYVNLETIVKKMERHPHQPPQLPPPSLVPRPPDIQKEEEAEEMGPPGKFWFKIMNKEDSGSHPIFQKIYPHTSRLLSQEKKSPSVKSKGMEYWKNIKDGKEIRASFQFRNIVSVDTGKEIVEIKRPIRQGFTQEIPEEEQLSIKQLMLPRPLTKSPDELRLSLEKNEEVVRKVKQKQKRLWVKSKPERELSMEFQAQQKSRRVMMRMLEAGQKVLTKEVVHNICEGTYKNMIHKQARQEQGEELQQTATILREEKEHSDEHKPVHKHEQLDIDDEFGPAGALGTQIREVSQQLQVKLAVLNQK